VVYFDDGWYEIAQIALNTRSGCIRLPHIEGKVGLCPLCWGCRAAVSSPSLALARCAEALFDEAADVQGGDEEAGEEGEGDQGGEGEAEEDDDAAAAVEFGACAGDEDERRQADQGGAGGHDDGADALQSGMERGAGIVEKPRVVAEGHAVEMEHVLAGIVEEGFPLGEVHNAAIVAGERDGGENGIAELDVAVPDVEAGALRMGVEIRIAGGWHRQGFQQIEDGGVAPVVDEVGAGIRDQVV